MLAGAELYRQAFEHEIEANHAMLKMLAGVPESSRSDERFQRAVNIAAHMCDCRANYLDLIKGEDDTQRGWLPNDAELASLDGKFAQMESAWKEFLAKVDESTLGSQFVFADNGERWRISTEAQVFQLLGHAAYHRGQVVLLVDQLGGETFNTDYIDWFTENHPEGWGIVE